MKYIVSDSLFRFSCTSIMVTVFCFFANSAEAVEPSFNCSDQLNPTESAICMSDTLSRLDRKASAAYKKYAGRIGVEAARVSARQMLQQRNACRSEMACIERRIVESIAVFEGNEVTVPGYSAFQAMSVFDRKRIQISLRNLGLYNSEIDGVWGPGTEKGFRKFVQELPGDQAEKSGSFSQLHIETAIAKLLVYCIDCEPGEEGEVITETQSSGKTVKSATNNAPSVRNSAFTTMFGVSIGMSYDEVRSVLWSRFPELRNCTHRAKGDREEILLSIYVRPDSRLECTGNHITTMLSPYVIVHEGQRVIAIGFGCQMFNGCGRDGSELAKELHDAGVTGKFSGVDSRRPCYRAENDTVCIRHERVPGKIVIFDEDGMQEIVKLEKRIFEDQRTMTFE